MCVCVCVCVLLYLFIPTYMHGYIHAHRYLHIYYSWLSKPKVHRQQGRKEGSWPDWNPTCTLFYLKILLHSLSWVSPVLLSHLPSREGLCWRYFSLIFPSTLPNTCWTFILKNQIYDKQIYRFILICTVYFLEYTLAAFISRFYLVICAASRSNWLSVS